MLSRLLIPLLLVIGGQALAHEPSLAYLELEADGAGIQGRWDVALIDLETAVGLDRDGDRRIVWAEIESRRAEIEASAASGLTLSGGGAPCATSFVLRGIDDHGGSPYAVLGLETLCPTEITDLTIDYSWLLSVDANHRALLELGAGARAITAIVAASDPPVGFELANLSPLDTLGALFVEGVRHIWQGFDHLLFLLVLLLPVILRPEAAGRARGIFWPIVKLVTVFTVAHSITLGLASFGLVSLPPVLVESTIAASIIAAAVVNLLWPRSGIGLPIAFLFGLIHGLGFAGALAELSSGSVLMSLIGFNLGVEAGQLVIVAAAVPLIWLVSRRPSVARPVVRLGSTACAAIGFVWLVERLG